MPKPKMIFHMPAPIDISRKVASQIRPQRMIKAFSDIGYEVVEVVGDARTRAQSIAEIGSQLHEGIKFDFLYSEGTTMPTLLTEPNHLPLHPRLDFGFFKQLKRHNIPIGLFYRDVYWQFPVYNTVPLAKRTLAKAFYRYDLKKYNELLDILYLPTLEMSAYLPERLWTRVRALPPGLDIVQSDIPTDTIRPIFVGGLTNNYDIRTLVQAVSQLDNIKLTVVTPETEWTLHHSLYEPLLSPNVSIVHASGEDLEQLYRNHNVGLFVVEPNEYLNFAMPFKIFDYLGHGLPIIATEDTAAGNLVESFDVGLTVENEIDDIIDTFNAIATDPSWLPTYHSHIQEVRKSHTWQARAEQVAAELRQVGYYRNRKF